MEQIVTLYTSVKPSLYRNKLLKGCFAGMLGALILLISTLYIHQKEMEFWGPILGFFALILVGIGFRPFLKLKKLDSKPDSIKISADHIFWKNLRVVNKNIAEIRYVDEGENYGIEVVSKEGQKLFLPYFSKRSFEELKENLFI